MVYLHESVKLCPFFTVTIHSKTKCIFFHHFILNLYTISKCKTQNLKFEKKKTFLSLKNDTKVHVLLLKSATFIFE